MTQTETQPDYQIEFRTIANGKLGKMAFEVLDGPKVCHTDRVDPQDSKDRKRAAREMARALGKDAEAMKALLNQACNHTVEDYRRLRQQVEAGSAEAVPQAKTELLDFPPDTLRRPLCLVDGKAYAATWCPVRVRDQQQVRIENRLLIVRDDGQVWADGDCGIDARPIAELEIPVCLPSAVKPRISWSGAGVTRYLAGERPDPKEVFERLVEVVDTFLDFSRSLDDQLTVCRMVACYALATYLLDAFSVVGYLWPNGEAGCGKTTLLQVVAEIAYLGNLILAGSSYPCLRDLADYGATICFDDAEAVMDKRRTDPDKRALLLAGNRRGATIDVKELVGDRWETREVNTYCARLFSAINLPDATLGSRCIIVPLVRSDDPVRCQISPMDNTSWPCDRRRLIDDLWALGLAHLSDLRQQDREAVQRTTLVGRALEPWRAILAVAHWMDGQGVAGLFDQMEQLSVRYQQERGNYEEDDMTRLLIRALLELTDNTPPGGVARPSAGSISQIINDIAHDEDLNEPNDQNRPFTTPNRVSGLLRRQRFQIGPRTSRNRSWLIPRDDVVRLARTHGVEVCETRRGRVAPEMPRPE